MSDVRLSPSPFFFLFRSKTWSGISIHTGGQKTSISRWDRSFWSSAVDRCHHSQPRPVSPLHRGISLQLALRTAAGPRPWFRLRFRWEHPFQVLQRDLSPRPLQPRPDALQPAAQRPAHSPCTRAAVARLSLLQGHAPRGHGLSGQLTPMAQGGEAVGRRLQLCGVKEEEGEEILMKAEDYL